MERAAGPFLGRLLKSYQPPGEVTSTTGLAVWVALALRVGRRPTAKVAGRRRTGATFVQAGHCEATIPAWSADGLTL